MDLEDEIREKIRAVIDREQKHTQGAGGNQGTPTGGDPYDPIGPVPKPLNPHATFPHYFGQ